MATDGIVWDTPAGHADESIVWDKSPIEKVGTNDPYEMLNPGKVVNAGMRALKKASDVWDEMAAARNEGPLSAGGSQPLTLAKTGVAVPTTAESPEGSAAMATATDILPTALGLEAPVRLGVKGLAAVAKAPFNFFNKTVQAGKVLRRAAGTVAGSADREAQIAALRNPPPQPMTAAPVPNSGPMTAQAVQDIPQGTTLQALQQQVAATPDNGVSIDFAKRLAGQRGLLEQAQADREAAAAPVRARALANASASGGVDAKDLLGEIAQHITSPMVQGSGKARTVMESTAQAIRDMTDANGKIDPAALYEFRKTGLNDIIQTANGNVPMSATQGGRFKTATVVRDALDSAIAKAGGGEDWQKYLTEYAARSKPIDALEESLGSMYSPEQQTAIGELAGAPRRALPHILNTKTVMANAGLGMLHRWQAPGIARAVADQLLNPSELADTLAASPSSGPVARPLSFAALVANRLRDQADQGQEQQ